MRNDLRLVLDTNVFLVSILPHHKYWWVFESIINQRYTLLVTNEILTEYLEKCIEKYGPELSGERLDFLLSVSKAVLVVIFGCAKQTTGRKKSRMGRDLIMVCEKKSAL